MGPSEAGRTGLNNEEMVLRNGCWYITLALYRDIRFPDAYFIKES